MDVNMPEMDGYQTTSKIHELCNLHDVKHPYIIALSAAFSENVMKVMNKDKTGVDLFLNKPIVVSEIQQIL